MIANAQARVIEESLAAFVTSSGLTEGPILKIVHSVLVVCRAVNRCLYLNRRAIIV